MGIGFLVLLSDLVCLFLGEFGENTKTLNFHHLPRLLKWAFNFLMRLRTGSTVEKNTAHHCYCGQYNHSLKFKVSVLPGTQDSLEGCLQRFWSVLFS